MVNLAALGGERGEGAMSQAAKIGLAGGAVMAVGLAASPALADCPGRAPLGATGSSIAAPQSAPNTCTTAYDGGVVTLSGHALGTVTDSYTQTQYQYDNRGDLIAQTTKDGITTYFGHDGPVTEVTDPQGHTIRFTYDAQHDVTAVTDTQGNTTHYGYDSQDRVTGVTDPLGRPSTYSYDAGGGTRMDTTTNGMGVTTTYSYDGMDRVTGSTMGGNTTTYSYDPGNGDMTGTQDTLGRTVTFGYDTMNRMVTETDGMMGSPITSTYTYGYDTLGDVTSQIDPLGKTTTYAYDPMGEFTGQFNPDGTTISETWSDGLLQSSTDPQGHTTTYTYDPLFRLIGENGPDGAFTFSPGVPEPATWAMMLIGLGALGLRLRSRRASAGAMPHGLIA